GRGGPQRAAGRRTPAAGPLPGAARAVPSAAGRSQGRVRDGGATLRSVRAGFPGALAAPGPGAAGGLAAVVGRTSKSVRPLWDGLGSPSYKKNTAARVAASARSVPAP